MVAQDFGPLSETVIPVQIRENLTVYIQGLPWNLTKQEAAKIAAVVLSMVQP